jgi:hypothetical protein
VTASGHWPSGASIRCEGKFGERCWKLMSGVDNQTKFVVPDGGPV